MSNLTGIITEVKLFLLELFSASVLWVDRIVGPKDAIVLVPGTYKYVIFTWERDFADGGKVINLQKRRENPGLAM